MKYLLGVGYDKAKLLGIAHEEYIRKTEQNGGTYSLNNTTKYNYYLRKHPVNDEYMLEIKDDTYLDATSKGQLQEREDIDDSWFVVEDDGLR
jgi:hypothetical protein